MSTSIRNYLLKELGQEETRDLMNISKHVRQTTQMTKSEKCNCCVCKARSKQMYPKEKDTEYIYNHHVMKVEYLAILLDSYDLCYVKNENIPEGRRKPNDYKYESGFSIYSPRVAVCDKHHTMFHELVGDNDLDKIRDIKINEADNLVDVFESFNKRVRKNNEPKTNDNENLAGYKKSYQSIWDETFIKSLTRLSYILSINELKLGDEKYSERFQGESLEDYERVISRIDELISASIEYDEENNIILPDVDMFSENDIELLDMELASIKDKESYNEILYNEDFDDPELRTLIDELEEIDQEIEKQNDEINKLDEEFERLDKFYLYENKNETEIESDDENLEA